MKKANCIVNAVEAKRDYEKCKYCDDYWENVPVIIPTLNRFTHLKRCVESLMKNDCIKNTDVYVSVDYPPSGEYIQGYKQVINYVKSIKGFRKVVVFFQKKNIGTRKNIIFLRHKIAKDYNKCFITEDDIEYAPHSLDFINNALRVMGERSYFLGVSCGGDGSTIRSNNENLYLIDRYSAYGFGCYIRPFRKMCKVIESGRMHDDIKRSFSLRLRLFMKNPYAYVNYTHDIMREIPAMRREGDRPRAMDFNISIYCSIYNRQCLFSRKRLMRNWGYDGSGIYSEANDSDPSRNELSDAKNLLSEINKTTTVKRYQGEVSWIREAKRIGIRALFRAIIISIAYNFLRPEEFDKVRIRIQNWRKKFR